MSTNIQTPRVKAYITVTSLTKPARVRTVPVDERPGRVSTDQSIDPSNYRGVDWSEAG